MEYISPAALQDIKKYKLKYLNYEYIKDPLEEFSVNDDIDGAIRYFEDGIKDAGTFNPMALLDETEILLAFAYLDNYFPPPIGTQLSSMPPDLARRLLRIFIKVSDAGIVKRMASNGGDELPIFMNTGVGIPVWRFDYMFAGLRGRGAFTDERLNVVACESYLHPLYVKHLEPLKIYAIEHAYPRRNARKLAYTVGHPNQRTKYVEDSDRPELGFRDLPDELKKEIAKMAGK